jgi:hypothetical protein
MAGKSKIVTGALEALTDAYKRTFDPKTYYHGSRSGDIEEFDPQAQAKTPDEAGGMPEGSRGATFFTSDPKYIDEILGLDISEVIGGEVIYPVKIKTEDVFDYENEAHIDDLINSFGKYWDREFGENAEKLIREGDWYSLEIPEIQLALKELGFRGYKTDESGTIGLFYPEKGDVRSVFAKFDPRQSESGNILASIPAAALATGGALNQLAED